jgi:hypothetical protein
MTSRDQPRAQAGDLPCASVARNPEWASRIRRQQHVGGVGVAVGGANNIRAMISLLVNVPMEEVFASLRAKS